MDLTGFQFWSIDQFVYFKLSYCTFVINIDVWLGKLSRLFLALWLSVYILESDC